jgi:hypothetical protein
MQYCYTMLLGNKVVGNKHPGKSTIFLQLLFTARLIKTVIRKKRMQQCFIL